MRGTTAGRSRPCAVLPPAAVGGSCGKEEVAPEECRGVCTQLVRHNAKERGEREEEESTRLCGIFCQVSS